jgi:hypothetical protein
VDGGERARVLRGRSGKVDVRGARAFCRARGLEGNDRRREERGPRRLEPGGAMDRRSRLSTANSGL